MKHIGATFDKLRFLPRSFYRLGTENVARQLLGKILLRKSGRSLFAGVIVETEAYLSENDPSCHAHRGVTPRSQVMFSDGGCLYVYTIHAKFCLNVVTEKQGIGCAVLIRAIQPLVGIKGMKKRRNISNIVQLTNGPAKLCQAMDIDLKLNQYDLPRGTKMAIGKLDGGSAHFDQTAVTPRIGISKAIDLPLRFFVDRNRFVSGRKRDHSGPADQQFEV